MGRKRRDENECPICGEYMDVLCSGHAQTPFVDGRKYDYICFVCFHVPKLWQCTYGRAKDGSQDVWNGPIWDPKSLYTAKELVAAGVCDDLSRASKSVKAIKAKLKSN